MEIESENLLVKGAKAFGIHLDEKTVRAFDVYLRELLKWNRKINLTAIRSEKGIVLSILLTPFLPILISPARPLS